MRYVVGIDPGLTGAIAILGDDGSLECFSMPVFDAKKKNIDPQGLMRCFRHRAPIGHVFIEAVHSMPGMGAPSVFSFGEGFGIIKGIVAALEFPVTFHDPAKWKRFYRLTKEKELSRQRATELFPKHSDQWAIVRATKDQAGITQDQAAGRAEAALLAIYGRQHLDQTWTNRSVAP